MAAWDADSWTVTIGDRWIEGKKKHVRATLAIGAGSDTYPTGGIPLPTYSNLGMKRNVDYIELIEPVAGNGFVYKYDLSAHTLLAYYGDYSEATDGALVEVANTDSTEPTVEVVVVGW